MLYDRREQILTLLKKDGSVKVVDLVKRFGVSIETIRRTREPQERGDASSGAHGAECR